MNKNMASRLVAAEPIDLWPTGLMPGSGAELPEGPQPSTGDGVIRLTNVSTPQITVYRPPGASEATPAVIICPGGGYQILAYNKEGTEIAEWLNSIGVTAVLLKYRVPGNREGALQDIRRTVRLVKANAGEWGIAADRIGVLGFSAGGHLCARLGTNPLASAPYPPFDAADAHSDRPDFVVLVYPAYLGKDGQTAPELPITAAVPPTLIIHAADDHAYIDGSRIYFPALQAARVPAEFKLYTTGGHGHGLRPTGTAAAWPVDCAAWLREQAIL